MTLQFGVRSVALTATVTGKKFVYRYKTPIVAEFKLS